uniref:Uncharacterized protein n=1 Tax=Romanomermis culicivorax TaxID=13658 RepID=A0A915JDU5_ROMCU
MSSSEKCRSKYSISGAKKAALFLTAAAAVSSVVFYGTSFDGKTTSEILENLGSSRNVPGVFLGPPKFEKGCSPPSSAPPASGLNDIQLETYSKDGHSARKYEEFVTATGGVLGALVALMSSTNDESAGSGTSSWILPFTAGGFLNIALVQILPDLMKERQFKENVYQVSLIVLGIAVMAMLNSSVVNM